MTPKLTAMGYNLMVEALSGTGINFSKVKIGNGSVPDDYRQLKDLMNPIISIDELTLTKEDDYAIVRAPMSNNGLEAGFYMTELGIFVEDPAGGDDILYAYAHYKLSGDTEATYIQPIASNLVEITHIIHVYVGEIENVSTVLTSSAQYASVDALNSHIENKRNPHNVDKEDVGLGNVENETAANQRPIFSNTILPMTTAVDGTKTVQNIQTGERMYQILQKIRSAISIFVDHLNGKNPHGLKAGDIGAAAETHYHSANQINSGVLGIPRGGTGGKTAAEARSSLGIQAGSFKVDLTPGAFQIVQSKFPKEFTETPKFVLTPVGSGASQAPAYVTQVTKTLFSVRITSEEFTGSMEYHWIAVG